MKNPPDPSHPSVVVLASRSTSAMRAATARNLETVIRERISRIGQKAIAERAQIDKTKMNRFVSDQGDSRAGIAIHEFYDFFAALGMGVVECDDPEMVSMPREEYEALRTLSRQALARISDPRKESDQ